MSKNNKPNSKLNVTKIFDGERIRSVWDGEKEEWYFSIVDVVAVLTESVDPKQYIKKMRARDEELSSGWGTICTPTEMVASDGKKYKTLASDAKGIFRIIQSIPSKKAEPFKQWLAQVGKERIDQIVDPERSILQGLRDYKRLGYSDNWINQRLKTIEIRKDLTDEWDAHGIISSEEYAILTDDMYGMKNAPSLEPTLLKKLKKN